MGNVTEINLNVQTIKKSFCKKINKCHGFPEYPYFHANANSEMSIHMENSYFPSGKPYPCGDS